MGEQERRELIGGLTRAAEAFVAWRDAMQSELQERDGQLRSQAELLAEYLSGLREMAGHFTRAREDLQASLTALDARQAEVGARHGELSGWERELSDTSKSSSQAVENADTARELAAVREALEKNAAQMDELETLREALAKQHGHLGELEALWAGLVSQNAQPCELDALRGRVEELEKTLGGGPAAVPPRIQSTAPPEADLKNVFQKVLKSRAGGPRRQLGEILITSGILSRDQINEAVRIQVSDPQRRFGTIIVDLGYATEDVIGAALAAQQHTRFVENLEREMTPEAMRLVPQKLAIHHRCVPLTVGDGTLVMAMVNPLDLIAIEDIERATDASVLPVVATASAIDRVLAKYYSKTKSSGFTTR